MAAASSGNKKKKGAQKTNEGNREEKLLSAAAAARIIDVLVSVQAIGDPAANQAIYEMAVAAYEQGKDQTGFGYEPIKILLNEYGDPEEILARFEEEQLAKQRAEEEPKTDQEREDEKAIVVKELRKSSSQAAIEPSENKQLVPYRPPVDLSKKALVAIERIKKQKHERDARVYISYPYMESVEIPAGRTDPTEG